jgi:kynurenine formamidase
VTFVVGENGSGKSTLIEAIAVAAGLNAEGSLEKRQRIMLDQFFGVDGVDVIGLSHHWAPGKVCHYQGDPEYQLHTVATLGTEGYALNYVSVGEHTGTHWGAPRHFNEGEAAADELDPEDFFLPGVTIDIERPSQEDSDYALSVDDLEAWM